MSGYFTPQPTTLTTHDSHDHITTQSYVRDGLLAVLAPGEAVSELGVGELVQTAGGADAEVTPHVLTAAEVQLLHRARAGLEALQGEPEEQVRGRAEAPRE